MRVGGEMPERRIAEPYAFVVIGAVSLSMLTYQVLLTRVSALRLFFHFSFLVISNCLLGIGAAGSMITLCQDRWRRNDRFWIWLFCLLYTVSLASSYAFILGFDVPSSLNFRELEDFLRFTAFNLVSAVPFFFAGSVVGMILTFNAAQVNRVYFTDLVGAGLGCLLCPLMLWAFGAGGCLVFVTLIALLCTVASSPARFRGPVLAVGVVVGAFGCWLMPRLDAHFPVPGKGDLKFTETVTANVSDVTEHSQWSTNSRIDVLPVASDRRFVITMGRNAKGIPLPEEKFIVQDGSAGTFILNFSEHPEALRALELSMYSAALSISEAPRVFVIGMGGGNDVWAAKTAGASYVKGVELNAPILDIHQKVLPRYSRRLLDDPSIELVHGEGRSALMAENETYDLILMTGIDTWTALASGAYMLAENYLYTQEALEDMYSRLEDGGIIQIIRIGLAMESLRLLSNVDAMLRSMNGPDLRDSVAYLTTTDSLFAILIKKGRFTDAETKQLAVFAEEAGIDPIYLPGQVARQHVSTDFIFAKDRDRYIENFPRNISPTTDDKPYFFNYTKWGNPFKSIRYLREPTFMSQGNPFFIWAQLLVSTLLALALIAAPLAVSRHRHVDRAYARRFFVYFVGLGMGFISIEVAAMQKLTLFLGHPLYSITVTLFCILVFTGLGSLISARWFERSGERTWYVPLGIAALLGVFITVSPLLVDAFIGLPLAGRIAMTVFLLAPVSVLLGVPLAYGIRLLNRLNPTLIPWAWAVNACFTVVGSVFTVILSMNFGFNAVLVAAALIYVAAFAALPADRVTAAAGR